MQIANIPPATFTDQELTHAARVIELTSIRMSLNETALFLRLLSRSKSFFEFGSGGSTIAASAFGPNDLIIHSVDPNEKWLHVVENSSLVKRKLESGQLTLQYLNIGPLIGNWSSPIWSAEEAKGAFEAFSKSIEITRDIDLVLVDSRFRVSCAINAMMKKPNATVMFHDFYEPMHHGAYNMLLLLMDVVERADTLVVLARRQDATDKRMMKMYLRHAPSPNRL